jgi:hypothetical protein
MPIHPPFGRTRIKRPEIPKPLLVVNDASGPPMIDDNRYVAFNVSTGGYILARGKKRTYLGCEHGRAVEAHIG